MSRLVVSTLHISDAVAAKLAEKHDLHPAQVRAAIEGVGRLPFRWAPHPDSGTMRALVSTAIDGQAVMVVLFPSRTGDALEWHLASAYPN